MYQSGPFRGNAALSWVDADDVNVERVLLLREALREIRPGAKQKIYAGDSLDFSQRQVFYIGQSVDELTGKIRFMDDPQGCIDLLKAASKNRTITYLPNLADPGRSFACYLVSPINPTVLKMDGTAGVEYGLRELEITLRQTNGKAFDLGWAYETGMLFRYVAGGRLKDATFTRSTVGRYFDKLGVVQSAAAGATRIQWTKVSGVMVPTLLLEAAATNSALQSQALATAPWATTALATTNNAASAPDQTTTATNLVPTAVSSATHEVVQAVTITAGEYVATSVFLKPNGYKYARFITDGASGNVAAVVDLNLGVINQTSSLGYTITGSNIVALGSGWYWVPFWFKTVTDTTAILRVRAFDTLADAQNGTAYTGDGTSGILAWGAQLERNGVSNPAPPTSYIATTTVPVARSADALNLPWPFAPQVGWFYIKFLELGAITSGQFTNLMRVGSISGTTQFLILAQEGVPTAGSHQYDHGNPQGTESGSGNVQPTYRQVVEMLALLAADGSITTISSVNNAAPVTAATGGAVGIGAAWGVPTLFLQDNLTNGGFAVFALKSGAGAGVNTLPLARAA